MEREDRAGSIAELERLRGELVERRKNLPAHSVRPHQFLAIEALEERIALLARELDGDE